MGINIIAVIVFKTKRDVQCDGIVFFFAWLILFVNFFFLCHLCITEQPKGPLKVSREFLQEWFRFYTPQFNLWSSSPFYDVKHNSPVVKTADGFCSLDGVPISCWMFFFLFFFLSVSHSFSLSFFISPLRCLVSTWSPATTSCTFMRARTLTGRWLAVCRAPRPRRGSRAVETASFWRSAAMPPLGCRASPSNTKASPQWQVARAW